MKDERKDDEMTTKCDASHKRGKEAKPGDGDDAK